MTRLVADGLGDVLDTHAQHIWKHKAWLVVIICDNIHFFSHSGVT
jgi:hypothetical protein